MVDAGLPFRAIVDKYRAHRPHSGVVEIRPAADLSCSIVVFDEATVRFVILQANIEVGNQGTDSVAFENHR